MTSLEQYFQQFRDQIIGIDQDFVTPFGQKKLVYTILSDLGLEEDGQPAP